MKTRMSLMIAGLMTVFFYSSAQQVTKSGSPSSVDAQAKVKATPIVIKSNPVSGGLEYKNGLEGTPGSAYLNPDWQPGVIVMKDQTVIENLHMRYNLYTQQIQFVKETDTMAIGNPEDISKIRIADKEFVYIEYLDNNLVKSGYFELRQDGNCRLLKRWKAMYHLLDETTNNDEQTETFIKDCHCYLQLGDRPAFSAGNNKNQLLACFGNKSERVKEFMKKSNIKLKNEEDLKMVIKFYNSLE